MRRTEAVHKATDSITFLAGMTGIAYQTVTGKVDIALLIAFFAMTGAPGLTHLIGIGIKSQSSSPASVESSSDSPDVS